MGNFTFLFFCVRLLNFLPLCVVALRKIIHIDMDAFFASVEQLDNPELRAKPIAVGHDSPRSVVSTASYEARPYGVHSAQPIATAKRLCPQLIIVPPRFDRYKEISSQVHDIFSRYTHLIEPISIDEAFLDVTTNLRNIPLAMDVAKCIRKEIFDELHLTASAGVSYNKLLAKIASDYRKPNGLTVVHPDRALYFLDCLPVENLWGVGPKTKERMHGMNVYTCGQLREVPLSLLTLEFGKMGKTYYDFSRGIDDRPVIINWVRKSVSCEETFPTDVVKKSVAIIQLYHVVNELVNRISKHHFVGHTLTLKVKFADFSQITRSITQGKVLNDKADILPLAKQLLGKVDYATHPIRLLGLGVSRGDAELQEELPPHPQWHVGELPFKPY